MQELLNAKQVAETLNCAKSTAYKIIRQLNEELEKNGYITISGRLSKDYLCERLNIKSGQQGERKVENDE